MRPKDPVLADANSSGDFSVCRAGKGLSFSSSKNPGREHSRGMQDHGVEEGRNFNTVPYFPHV